jgi:hypothetical protein
MRQRTFDTPAGFFLALRIVDSLTMREHLCAADNSLTIDAVLILSLLLIPLDPLFLPL